MNSINLAYKEFCEERFPLPTEQQVADLERRIGVIFPDDYRRFLLAYNGGYFTEPDIIPPIKECPLDRLRLMHGIGASHSEAELASPADLALFDDNDPPEAVPIGYTLMGNLLILITYAPEPGGIVLKRAYSDQYFYMADTMEEFFSLLREPPNE